MADHATHSLHPDGPNRNLLRIVVERYLSVWETTKKDGARPAPTEVLSAIPEAERAALRPFLDAFDSIVATVPTTPAAQDKTVVFGGPETIDVGYDTSMPTALTEPAPGGQDQSSSFTGEYTPDGPGSTHALPAQRSADRQLIPGYEIIGELGRGGMGVVYKALQVRLRRPVAIKLMLQAAAPGTVARERFDVEAESIARMQHPNIVQLFEIGEVDGKPFFSLEYVDGGTLSEKVAQHLLRPKETAKVMVTLARAMHYAHEHGIVHRDLKPGNVLMTEDGEPKITDFGLARKLEEDSHITRMGTVVGTPSYMPPEQAAGELDRVGKSADIYSLGAILYDLLTGRPPFKGAHILETLEQVRTKEPLAPSSLQPGTPRDLETICLKCLQKDPERRYATSAELADDLQRFLQGEPILARPIGTLERAWRWCKRNQRVAVLLGAVAVLLLLITAGSTTAAIFVNRSRNEISQQKDTIADQLVEITAKEKLAKDRLDANRDAVDGFVNEAPSILSAYPLAGGPAEEMLQLTVKLLNDVEGKAEVAGLTDRGRLSILLQQSELARVQRKSEDVAQLLDEAHRLAETLAASGQPERDKSTGNLALVLNLQAGEARNKGKFADAIALHEQAMALQKRVLDSPDSGEISAVEARTWIGNTQFSLATTHAELAKSLPDREASRRELNLARGALESAEQNFQAAIAKATGRQAERLSSRVGLAALEYGRVSERLGDFKGVTDGYEDAFKIYENLVKEHPKNLSYKLNLSIAAAEYGDILLIQSKDIEKARKMYTYSVFFLRPIAQPTVLEPAQKTLALNYYRVATAARVDKDEVNAKRLYGLCLELRESQFRAAQRLALADKKSDPDHLQHAMVNLMLAHARFGNYKEAVAIANDTVARVRASIGFKILARSWTDALVVTDQLAEELPRLAVREFNAGIGFGLSSVAAPAEERTTLLERAFECVHRAIDLGYRDQETLEHDPDVAPLRSDPRFQEVLERVVNSSTPKK